MYEEAPFDWFMREVAEPVWAAERPGLGGKGGSRRATLQISEKRVTFHVKHFRRPFVGKYYTLDVGALWNTPR